MSDLYAGATSSYEMDQEQRMHEMEPALRSLLSQQITSLARWDVLRYFLETESEQATLDEIGLAAGRDSDTMLEAVGSLTSQGWLSRRSSEEGATFYRLTQERSHRELLDQLRAALHERTFRLQALYHWTVGR